MASALTVTSGRTLCAATRRRFSPGCASATNQRSLFTASLEFGWRTVSTLPTLAPNSSPIRALRLISRLGESGAASQCARESAKSIDADLRKSELSRNANEQFIPDTADCFCWSSARRLFGGHGPGGDIHQEVFCPGNSYTARHYHFAGQHFRSRFCAGIFHPSRTISKLQHDHVGSLHHWKRNAGCGFCTLANRGICWAKEQNRSGVKNATDRFAPQNSSC